MLTAKRMLQHSALFGSVLGVVAVVCALAIGLVGFGVHSTTTGLRDDLVTRTGGDAAGQVTMRLAADAAAQDAVVRDILRAAFTAGGRTVPLEVERTVGTLGVMSLSGGPLTGPADVSVLSVEAFDTLAELVAGAWPTGPDEVSMQADAAAALGVAIGDRVLLTDREVDLTATWRILDPLAPRWMGAPDIATGTDGEVHGPLIVDERLWQELAGAPRAQWTISPDRDRIEPADIAAIMSGWDALHATARADGRIDPSSLGQHGRLPRTAELLQEQLDAVSAVRPIALLTVLVVAVLTLIELSRLLGGVRTAETELLWSRGASPLVLATRTAVEAGVVAVAGAALGVLLAAGALALAGTGLPSAGASVWAVPAAAVLATTVLFGAGSAGAARRSARRDTRVQSGRVRTITGLGGFVLVAVGAVVCVWQLLLYRSLTTPVASGGTQVDPVAVLAPPLGLAAVVLGGLLLFPVLAPLAEHTAGTSSGLRRTLAARSVARRLPFAAAPIVLVALASGQLVVATAYATTWGESFDTVRELRNGAPIMVTAGRSGVSPLLPRIHDAPAVTAVTPVDVANAGIGTEFGTLIGVAPNGLAELANSGRGRFDAAAAAAAITSPVPLPAIPESAVEVTVTGEGTLETARLTLVDETGRVALVPLAAEDGPALRLAGAVPDGGPWRIAALDLWLPDDAEGFRVDGITCDTVPVDLPYWVAVALGGPVAGSQFFGVQSVRVTTDGSGFADAAGMSPIRMLPSLSGTGADDAEAPVVVSQALADRFNATIGSTLPISLENVEEPILTQVAGIAPAIPGASDDLALLIDVTMLVELRLRAIEAVPAPNVAWIASDDPLATVTALRAELPAAARVSALADDPARRILGAAAVELWAGAAGAAVLAVLAVAAVAGAQLRARRSEVVVLRAVGVPGATQSSVRRIELAVVLGYGAFVGIAAGLAVAFVTVATIARAAVPDPYASLPTTTAFDPLLLPACLGVFGVALTLLVVIYGARVSAQVRSLSAREELG